MIQYFRLIKFSHTIFSLPFAVVGFLFAIDQQYKIEWHTAIFILLALIAARTAAMAFNRWADKVYDAKNPRTSKREIPAGYVKPFQAMMLTIVSSAVFVFLSALINELCLILSPVALLVIIGYSYTKRFTFLSHLILGVGLAIAPAAAFIAVSNTFDVGLLFLCFGVLFWVAGFDIIYALQDIEFDKQEKLHSIPSKLGYKRSLQLAALFHLISILLMFHFGFIVYGDFIALLGIILFSLMIIYQHINVRLHGLKAINLSFGTMNGVASLFFGAAYLLDFFLF